MKNIILIALIILLFLLLFTLSCLLLFFMNSIAHYKENGEISFKIKAFKILELFVYTQWSNSSKKTHASVKKTAKSKLFHSLTSFTRSE